MKAICILLLLLSGCSMAAGVPKKERCEEGRCVKVEPAPDGWFLGRHGFRQAPLYVRSVRITEAK